MSSFLYNILILSPSLHTFCSWNHEDRYEPGRGSHSSEFSEKLKEEKSRETGETDRHLVSTSIFHLREENYICHCCSDHLFIEIIQAFIFRHPLCFDCSSTSKDISSQTTCIFGKTIVSEATNKRNISSIFFPDNNNNYSLCILREEPHLQFLLMNILHPL